jgi:dihydrofolate reductase
MRKVIATAFVSLDGVMQAPGGPDEDPTGGFKYGGWTAPYFDEVLGQAMGEAFSKPFDLLLGRKTYEIFAAHWPYAEGGGDDFIAELFNKVDIAFLVGLAVSAGLYFALTRSLDLTAEEPAVEVSERELASA